MSLLTPLSLLYRCGLSFDRALKTLRRHRLPRPVISIGNISVGGTGKTPLVLKLLTDLKKMGVRPAVLTRGYRSDHGFSDEAALFMRHHPDVPVGVGADRYKTGCDLLAHHKIDVFVLDDGFQHWALHRNLDIVCIDATAPDGELLPAGLFREPLGALKRADAAVLTRLELLSEEAQRRLSSRLKPVVESGRLLSSSFKTRLFDWKTGQSRSMKDLDGKKMVVLSAVGRPEAFEEMVKRAGAEVIPLRFRDHHTYRDQDLRRIEVQIKTEEADLITTEKDLVKLERTKWGKLRALDFRAFVAFVEYVLSPADNKTWEELIRQAVTK